MNITDTNAPAYGRLADRDREPWGLGLTLAIIGICALTWAPIIAVAYYALR